MGNELSGRSIGEQNVDYKNRRKIMTETNDGKPEEAVAPTRTLEEQLDTIEDAVDKVPLSTTEKVSEIEAVTLAKTTVEPNKWYLTTGEITRTYVFPHGEYTIENPKKVLIKRKPEGDSHRVISHDEDGKPQSHYIPCGWIAIRWNDVDKTKVFGW